jgi:hypothetical protein
MSELAAGRIPATTLSDLVREAFGPGRRLTEISRIREATKNGVLRLAFTDGPGAILYAWDPTENWWPTPDGDPAADPLSDASGAELFEVAHARLVQLGVGTPEVYLLDRSRSRCPYDVALVEEVRGEDLEGLLERDPAAAEPTLAALGEALAVLHAQASPHFGKVALVERGVAPQHRPWHELVVDKSLRHLADAADQVPALQAARDRLEQALHERAAAITPRTSYRLIHGELDPGHVLVGPGGRPLLIDIEGLMFLDVEWEHPFLELRYGEHYRWLRADGLDEARLGLYRLAMHLSLVAGPLRLIATDHPHGNLLRHIIDHNTRAALTFA